MVAAHNLTLSATAILLVLSPLIVLISEWPNPATLGGLPMGECLLSGWFTGITPRTAGFNSIDYASRDPATLLTTDILMVIGGGSAGTAGGINGGGTRPRRQLRDPGGSRRRRVRPVISSQTVRQALSVTVLGLALVGAGTLFLLEIGTFSLDQAAFEVTSALATVGLSTGITADIPPAGQTVLIMPMFLGRVGR